MAGARAEITGERQTRSRPFPCDECSKLFTRNENLQRHKRARHHGPTRHDFECDKCHAGFTRSDVFKRHRDRCQVEVSLGHSPQSHPQLQQIPQETVDMTSIVASTELPAANATPDEPLWEEHSSFDNSIPQEIQSHSPMDYGNYEVNVKNYFEHFHPSLPLLHRPTFTVSTAPKLLLKALSIIGSLFSISPSSDEQAQWRSDMWQSGQQELRSMVFNDCSEIRQVWVMQAWILYMIYGVYTKDAAEGKTARQMLRQLVDAVREIGLSQQEIAMPESQSWLYDSDYTTGSESQTLFSRWTSYISAESMRLSLYTLVFLDSHAFLPCNSRPLMSSMELGWELPFPVTFWEAKDPEIWIRRFNEYFGVSAFTFTDDLLHRPRGLATASLTIATQNLMTETPGLEILSALETSPFATFCVLTNLEALVRDFTRCYYQMPPSYSDPNPFHILTQNQTKSFHMAIRNIGRIVKNMASASESPHFFLWRTNELFIVSLKVSLCRPDRLLIGGIVDNSLIAGMAASTHLTQGNFVAIRRSAPLVPLHFGGNEGVLALLSDFSIALSSIFGDDPNNFTYEAPWVTVASYSILLCIWEALRRAKSEIHVHMDTFNDLPRTSESCMLIFNTLVESTLLCSQATEHDRSIRDSRLWSRDREVFPTLLEDGQSLFANLIQNFCKQRSVWGIGPSMLAVLSELTNGVAHAS